MRKNDKFRDFNEGKMGGGHDYMENQNNYDAIDDGYNQPPKNKQIKTQDGRDFKPKGKGGVKQSNNSRKDYNNYGDGKPSNFNQNEDLLDDYGHYQPGEYRKNTSQGYQEGLSKKPIKSKQEFGESSSGNKIYTNHNQFYSIPMKTQQGDYNQDRNRNHNKGEEKLERIHFYNSEKFKIENNFEKLNIHGVGPEEDHDLKYGFNVKEKNNNNDNNNQGKKGKKGKKKKTSKGGSVQSLGEKDEDFGNRKNKKQIGNTGIQEHHFDDQSASSELGIENNNMHGVTNMMQPNFMHMGKPLPQQFMPHMFSNTNPMINQINQQGNIHSQPYVQMPSNNGQQFVPNMSSHQIPQIVGPRLGVPSYGTSPYQNYVQPQMGGMQPMFYDSRLVRLPHNNLQQPHLNSNFHLQFKPNDQIQFNNMQQMIQNNQQSGKDINDKQLVIRGLNPNLNPTVMDPKMIHQKMQDSQARLTSNFNQHTINPINQQNMIPGMYNMQPPRIPPYSHLQIPNFPHQPRIPQQIIHNPGIVLKPEDNYDKDSDSNQETNRKNEMNMPDFGSHEINHPHFQKNQMLFRQQEIQFPGYNDYLSEKQSPTYLQQLQPKSQQQGFNSTYEEQQHDFLKTELKLPGTKYLQQDYLQKYSQHPQEKLDIKAKEFIPNHNLLN